VCGRVPTSLLMRTCGEQFPHGTNGAAAAAAAQPQRRRTIRTCAPIASPRRRRVRAAPSQRRHVDVEHPVNPRREREGSVGHASPSEPDPLRPMPLNKSAWDLHKSSLPSSIAVFSGFHFREEARRTGTPPPLPLPLRPRLRLPRGTEHEWR
jgi:hypothetical protein